MENSVEEASVSLVQENPAEDDKNLQLLGKRAWQETKNIVRITFPSAVFRVTANGVFIVTQLFIGHVSAVDLAAYALVQSISMGFVNGIALGMSSATETLCGQAFGAKQYHMLGIYLQRSWIVNFVTVTILLPIMIFATPIYELLGEKDNISEATEAISLWFIPILYNFVFSMTIQMFLQAQMKNAIIGYLSAVLFVVHLLVSWVFVEKLNLGVAGAMGAMIISRWGLVFGEWVYIFGGWCGETWHGLSKLAFADLLPVVKLSISSAFMLCLEIWYSSILVLIAGYSDNAVVEISAFSICLNVSSWEFMVALSLTVGASVRVSNELGRGNIEAAKFSIKILLLMSAALGIFFFLLVIIFGHSFPYLFTSDVKVAEAAGNLFILLALTMLVSSLQATFTGVAVGCGTQAKVAVINVVSYYAVGIPIGCLLGFLAKLGVKGIWMGMLIGQVVQVIALVVLTWRIDWEEEVNKTARRLGRFLLDSPGESNQSSDPA